MSLDIDWFLARALGKYFLTGPFRHPVVGEPCLGLVITPTTNMSPLQHILDLDSNTTDILKTLELPFWQGHPNRFLQGTHWMGLFILNKNIKEYWEILYTISWGMRSVKTKLWNWGFFWKILSLDYLCWAFHVIFIKHHLFIFGS